MNIFTFNEKEDLISLDRAVDVLDAVRNQSTKCSSQGAHADEQGNPDRDFIAFVPEAIAHKSNTRNTEVQTEKYVSGSAAHELTRSNPYL